MKSIVMATGYSQDLLDQPIAETIQPNVVMLTAFRPVELGGAAVKTFRSNLKKYAGITGVPGYGTCGSYITCDMMIQGLKSAGKSHQTVFHRRCSWARQVRRGRAHLRADRRQPRDLRSERRHAARGSSE